MTKWVTRESQLNETLHFLLDHPRRCYIYLFQSHQTWFLLAVTALFTYVSWLFGEIKTWCCFRSLEWFFFLLLDIGNAAIEAIPLNIRFSSGLFQAVAVRAAGFTIFSLADVSPAVQWVVSVFSLVHANDEKGYCIWLWCTSPSVCLPTFAIICPCWFFFI